MIILPGTKILSLQSPFFVCLCHSLKHRGYFLDSLCENNSQSCSENTQPLCIGKNTIWLKESSVTDFVTLDCQSGECSWKQLCCAVSQQSYADVWATVLVSGNRASSYCSYLWSESRWLKSAAQRPHGFWVPDSPCPYLQDIEKDRFLKLRPTSHWGAAITLFHINIAPFSFYLNIHYFWQLTRMQQA